MDSHSLNIIYEKALYYLGVMDRALKVLSVGDLQDKYPIQASSRVLRPRCCASNAEPRTRA